jgi:hypothetical protein
LVFTPNFSRREFLRTAAAGSAALGACSSDDESAFTPIFNGQNLDGWEGDDLLWAAEDGMLIGRSPGIGYNDFLAASREYGNFVLRFDVHLVGNNGNSGVQFRSRRVSGSMEMSGYQADIGEQYWASLYDESRRRKTLAGPAEDVLAKALKADDWNAYEVRAEGNHIQLGLNGVTTVDYTEEEAGIEQTGSIAVQIHSGPAMEVRFRRLRIREL